MCYGPDCLVVYAPEVVESVSVALRGKTELAEVTLTEAYFKNAGSVVKVRAAEPARGSAMVLGR